MAPSVTSEDGFLACSNRHKHARPCNLSAAQISAPTSLQTEQLEPPGVLTTAQAMPQNAWNKSLYSCLIRHWLKLQQCAPAHMQTPAMSPHLNTAATAHAALICAIARTFSPRSSTDCPASIMPSKTRSTAPRTSSKLGISCTAPSLISSCSWNSGGGLGQNRSEPQASRPECVARQARLASPSSAVSGLSGSSGVRWSGNPAVHQHRQQD
jgi:hypothetical protein